MCRVCFEKSKIESALEIPTLSTDAFGFLRRIDEYSIEPPISRLIRQPNEITDQPVRDGQKWHFVVKTDETGERLLSSDIFSYSDILSVYSDIRIVWENSLNHFTRLFRSTNFIQLLASLREPFDASR